MYQENDLLSRKFDSKEIKQEFYHAVYDKRVQLLPHQTAFPCDLEKDCNGKNFTVIEVLKSIKENIGEASTNLRLARKCGKGNENYNTYKAKSKHIIWGSISKSLSFEEDNIDSFTGIIYCDIDDTEIAKSNYKIPELKRKIIQCPWVIGVWKSFGGKGIGFIVNCNQIKSIWDYNNCYEQLTEYFIKELGTKLDSRCQSPVRKNALSFDDDILINKQPTEFIFEERPEPIKTNNYKLKNDSELVSNDVLFYHYSELFKEFYISYSIAEKVTGNPLPFNEEVNFDINKHFLLMNFTKEVIAKAKFHNENCTLGYLPEGLACVKIEIYPKLKIIHGTRRKTIQCILSNYLFLQTHIKNLVVSKLDLYNAALALNEKCYHKGGHSCFPLPEVELNHIICCIYEKANDNSLRLSLKRRTTIINEEFYKSFSSNEIKQLGKPLLILNAVRKLVIGNKAELFYLAYDSSTNYFVKQDIKPTKKQLAEKMSLLLGTKVKSIQNTLSALSKENIEGDINHSTYINLLIKRIMGVRQMIVSPTTANVTPSFNDAVQNLLKSEEIISRKKLAALSYKSVRQIARIWKPFKKEIEEHNKRILQSQAA